MISFGKNGLRGSVST